MEEEEQQEDHAGPAHRAAGEVGGDVLPRRLVVHRSRPAVHDRQRVGGMEVQGEGADQHETQQPQGHRSRQRGHEQLAQPLAVEVDVVALLALMGDDPEVHLEVADHVHHDEAHADQTGDGHHVLLADCGGVQIDEERFALADPGRGAAHRLPRDNLCHTGQTVSASAPQRAKQGRASHEATPDPFS